MASLLARLKSRKKDKSTRRESQEDETRANRSQDFEESSEEEDSRAVSQPPPQLPALDFSHESRDVNARVRDDQHVEHPDISSAGTMAPPRNGMKGNNESQVSYTQAAVPPENASLWEPDTDSAVILSRRLQALRLSPSTPEMAHMAVDTPACVKAREAMVQQIADGIRERRSGRSITEEGRRVFSAAGLEDRLEARDTIDVHTRWLPPVVQEHVIRREHTEYLIVINREVHKYHIYPKILPVSDPQPILLEPRHRLFDAVTGQWHEVIGDQAAIDILGEDVFHNGPKEVRTTRAMALPGFGPVAQMTEEERRKHGLGAVDENGTWIDGTEERLTMNIVI